VEIDSGTVTIHTDVAGSASRMGHRLVIAVDDWSASVQMRAKGPVAVQFRAALDSLRVESGSGGITPLTPVDKQVIVRNATKTLDVKRHPEVTFHSTEMLASTDRIDVVGELTIHGVTRPLTATLALADGRATASLPVRQTDFEVKPYSLMFGQLKVADEVVVELDVEIPG
jgi:polyisoprenoid-binding protein YceI